MLTILMARPSVTAIVDTVVVGCGEIDEESLSKISKSYQVDASMLMKKQKGRGCFVVSSRSRAVRARVKGDGVGGSKLIRRAHRNDVTKL
jgi:hypothetical protein